MFRTSAHFFFSDLSRAYNMGWVIGREMILKNEFKGKSRGNRFWLEVGTRFNLTRVWIEGVEGLHCIPDSHIQQNSTSDLNLVSDTQSNYLSPFLSV